MMDPKTLPRELLAWIQSPNYDVVAVSKLGLAEFVKLAWNEIEPDRLQFGWHMDQVCAHLEAVSRGECKRLVINVPPGCSKSTLVSVLWPAWDWIQRPSRKWMLATFADDLAWRDALRCRGLIRSQWYQQRWGSAVKIDEGGDVQATQSVFHTTAGGRRVSITVGGMATGWHADIQVVDDPIKPRDITGAPDVARDALERTWRWWTVTMASRRADPKSFARVVIMQRLHEGDLVGRIIENDRDHEWTHLMLPMRFEPDRKCVTKWGGDVRTYEGELLHPDRFDDPSVRELEHDLGGQAASAQLQQRPAPAAGNIFKREWFAERWKELPMDMTCIQTWDLAFKDKAGADYCAGFILGYSKGKYYVIDRIKERLGVPEVCRCIEGWKRIHSRARAVLIEDKANGPAIEQILRDRVTGIIMWPNNGGKIAQANAASPLVEAGNVILPDVSVKDWADDVFEELVTFPFAKYVDQTDAICQGLLYLHDHAQTRYLTAMRKIAAGGLKIV